MSVQPSSDMTCGCVATLLRFIFSIWLARVGRRTEKFSEQIQFKARARHFNDGHNYKKYRHPGQSDVVERDGALKWVPAQLRAVGVVLIPVDTGSLGWSVSGARNSAPCGEEMRKLVTLD
jgi:hypothetical protein